MIENPKIGQEVWFAEACNQRIHSAKLIALDEVEVSTRKYLYAKIEMDDGCRLGWPLKNLYASREELQKELEKKEEREQQLFESSYFKPISEEEENNQNQAS